MKLLVEIAARIYMAGAFLVRPRVTYEGLERDFLVNSEKVQEMVRLATIEAENRITESYESVIQRMVQNRSDYYITHK